MKHTEMPAKLLTADSIWNSFRSSHKKHLILTGSRGSGKSTLLKKLVPEAAPGIRTWAVPGTGVFMQENGAALQAQIGVFQPDSREGSNRMAPVTDGFLNLGIPALARCESSRQPFVVLDEIGYLEASCPEYCAAIEHLLEKRPTIAVLRKQELPFLNSIRERDDVFVLDLDAPFGNGGCVIMCSGLGTRFGGNKLMADFLGKPLIAGCLEATACIPHRVVVTRHRAVAEYCQKRSIPVILHDLPYRSDTVRLGTQAIEGTVYCIFCQGDQPLLQQDTVAAMAMLGMQRSTPILRAAAGDTCGAPILFPCRFYSELKSLPQGKGGGFVAKKHPEQVQLVPVRDAKELMDVDTPEDLTALVGK